jgi:hypothetical protein
MAASGDLVSKSSKDSLTALSLIMEYPALVHHEEQMIKSPYNVLAWSLYLDLLDDLLTEVAGFAVVKNQEKVVALR